VAIQQPTVVRAVNRHTEPAPHPIFLLMVLVGKKTSKNAKDRPLAIVAVAQASVAVRQLAVGRAVNLHMEHALQLRQQ
jgi:hypothetical protein